MMWLDVMLAITMVITGGYIILIEGDITHGFIILALAVIFVNTIG